MWRPSRSGAHAAATGAASPRCTASAARHPSGGCMPYDGREATVDYPPVGLYELAIVGLAYGAAIPGFARQGAADRRRQAAARSWRRRSSPGCSSARAARSLPERPTAPVRRAGLLAQPGRDADRLRARLPRPAVRAARARRARRGLAEAAGLAGGLLAAGRLDEAAGRLLRRSWSRAGRVAARPTGRCQAARPRASWPGLPVAA